MHITSLTDTLPLQNGTAIPCIGYGTWQTPDGQVAEEAEKAAIVAGYRHNDCAAVYGNEESVGRGIRRGLEEAGIRREELFVTGKVWTTHRGYEKTLEACEKSLKDLGLSYFDLYLIHWPANEVNCPGQWELTNLDSWRAMMELYRQKKVRAIGVSNFLPHHLQALLQTQIPPMVDQIEFHPGWTQLPVVEFCRSRGIVVEGWSPMGSGAVLKHPVLTEIAQKYGKTVAHLCIRYALQHGVLPLPKSVTPSRILDNRNVFDFEISASDMAVIDALSGCGWSGNNPDTFQVF